MTPPLLRPATVDGLFLWVLHRFAEVFEEHAVVKGGIALRLLDCPRSTTDIDYVFVPYESKNDVVRRIEEVLREIDGGRVQIDVDSKMVRARLKVDDAAIQIEANVDLDCPSMALPTAAFATLQGQPSRLVRAIALERALANKLGAWNERRLLRDLYDVYYLGARLGARVELEALRKRLARVESRLPALRSRRSMSMAELCDELRTALGTIDDTSIQEELAPILPEDELAGLVPRLRAGALKVIEALERSD